MSSVWVFSRRFWLAAGMILAVSCSFWAQDKASLQAERDAIQRKIETTEKLLNQTSSSKKDALVALRLIDERMNLRGQLIRHHQGEISSIEQSMRNADSEIRSLEGHILSMKDEYARMIQAAHRQSLSQNPWLYLFSAADFNQAVIRFRMLQSYSTLRKEHVAQIESAQWELTDNRNALANKRSELEEVLQDVKAERSRLAADRKTRAELVQNLKGEETRLRAEVQKAEAEKRRISDAIRAIIEAELAAERASSAGEFALTPEGKIVSAAFESNKTTLPWPVMRGVITGRFGRQAHPTLPGITIDNNGIDITTEKGSSVLAVFSGTVSSVFNIPGAGQTLILSHGAFRTVYSNLENVLVTKGQTVDTRERLGTVRSSNDHSVLHFEVWKISGSAQTPQNPATWLVKN